MKLNISHLIKKYGIPCYAIVGFFSINPYIFWETFKYYQVYDFIKIILELSVFILFILHIFIGKSKVKYFNIASIFGFTIIYFYNYLNNYDKTISLTIGLFSKYLLIIIFLMIESEIQSEIFEKFTKIFAISLIPSIIVFIITNIGINLNYEVLQSTSAIKISAGQQYRQYFGTVVIENPYWEGTFRRLCGMYDEPGMVGTISALLLIANRFNFKKCKYMIFILIGGIFSFSFAFLVLIIIYFILEIVRLHPRKSIKIFFAAFCITILICLLFKDNAIFQKYIFNRLSIYDGKLVGNNRTSSEFDIIFNRFMNEGNILLGEGRGNPILELVDVASYKLLILENGVIWFLGLVVWLVLFGIYKGKKNKKAYLLLFLFCLSIYQRPWIIYLYFIIILYGGISYLQKNNS